MNHSNRIPRPEKPADVSATTPRPGPMSWTGDRRYAGLVRFACAISILNVLGHTWLGFEQSWATPFVALAAAYATELLGETALAWSMNRRPAFNGGPMEMVKFLLSAHITGLAVGMLLYANEQLWVIAFATACAIASKYLFRVAVAAPPGGAGASRHFFNPSNFGIVVVLILFPWVGIAQPYQFTENVSGALNWILPLIVVCTGSLLNTKCTGRMPLIGAWLVTFAAQALFRAWLNDTPLLAGLVPMTGFAFILFTFYMVTDPATTPARPRDQMIYGAAVAVGYGILMQLHIVFGLFFALFAVCTLRGLILARPDVAAALRFPVGGRSIT